MRVFFLGLLSRSLSARGLRRTAPLGPVSVTPRAESAGASDG